MTTQHEVGAVPAITVAHRLRIAREWAGLEQGELAERMGISRMTVSNNERGEVRPRRITINAWALATGVNRKWLETGIAPVGGPIEGDLDEECAVRDSNPEPADLEYWRSRRAQAVAA